MATKLNPTAIVDKSITESKLANSVLNRISTLETKVGDIDTALAEIMGE